MTPDITAGAIDPPVDAADIADAPDARPAIDEGEDDMEFDAVGDGVAALIARAQGGDRAAFERVVAAYRARLHGFLRDRVGRIDDAEDLVQETFIRAHANLHRYDSRYQFSTWLFTIAKRLAANQYRSGQREAARMSEREEAVAVDPRDDLAGRDSGQRLWLIAERILKEDQYAALWLRYAEDLSIKEIAKALDRTAIHVRVLLFRARRRLAEEGA